MSNETGVLKELVQILKKDFFENSLLFDIASFIQDIFEGSNAIAVEIDDVNNQASLYNSKNPELISLEELDKKSKGLKLTNFSKSGEPGYIKNGDEVLIRLGKFDKDYFVILSSVKDNAVNEDLILTILQLLSFVLYLRSLIFSQKEALETNVEEQVKLRNYYKVLFHDLKTPLSTVSLVCELLKERLQDNIDLISLIEQGQSANREIIDTIEKFLDLEKVSERLQIETKKEDINKIIGEILKKVTPLYIKKNIHLETTGLDKPCIAEMDPFWIEKALKNIIENAFKYNVENGSVFIELSCASNSVVIKVRDTGIGIPKEDFKNIFEEFYRGRNAFVQPGYGIGLAVTKRIIDAHGGTIDIESEKGSGTTFIITIPRVKLANRSFNAAKKFLLFVLPILVIFGSLAYFPILPQKVFTKRNEVSTVLTLQDGTTIKLLNDASFDIKKVSKNLFGNKSIISISLSKGDASVSSKNTKVSVSTNYGTFVDVGTEFDVVSEKDYSNTSVFDGKVSLNKVISEKGYGIYVDKDGYKVIRLLHPVYNFTFLNVTDGSLQFNWEEIKEAREYEVMIAKDPEMTDILKVVKTKENKFNMTLEQDGYYYVRIQAIDNYGLKGIPLYAKIENKFHLLKGIKERDLGNYSSAMSEFNVSLKDYGFDNPDVLSEIAWTYYLQGNYEKAVSIYENILKVSERHEDKVRLALSYYHLGDFRDAEVLLISVLKENPNNADALWSYANVLFAEGDLKRAEELCRKTLSIDEKYPLANYLLGEILLRKGKITDAKAYLEKELRYYPDCKEARELLKSLNMP